MGKEKSSNSIFVSAGDPSGDIAGGHFLKALKEIHPNVDIFGLGGERMRSLGQEQFVRGSELAALGFWEVARRFNFFRKLLKTAVLAIKERRPKVVTLIDYPGFNLRLAEKIKKLGIPIVYYISPQVWAWGKGRIPRMRALIDRLLVLFEFEVEFFESHEIKAEYVGHYLLDDIPAEYIGAKYNADSNLIAVLPGSRQQEVDRMLPVALDAARLLSNDNLRFEIGGLSQLNYDHILSKYPEFKNALRIDSTRELIRDSVLVVSSAGTATLEVLLIGRPLIAIYKTSSITYQIARRIVNLKHYALANIVSENPVATELLQSDVTGEKIAAEITRIKGSVSEREKIMDEFRRSREKFTERGASRRVAEVVAEYINP
ncbi:MAG: lipid-A-disaccharide synthase [candidate division Zixibacteria bacterium]|nr:lipid-A-disaccharide synthase [candidate division Zixibacteria bacterium]